MTKLLPFAIVVLFVAGCGGNDNTSTSTDSPATTTAAPATTTPAAAGNSLTIHMSEFAFTPKDAVANAGKVTIIAPNDGKVVHELVVLKTSADPAHLPMDGDEVDESTNVGEVADVQPGATKKSVVKLTPGKYAIVCNLPGHYASGMYGSLTVK